MAAVYRGRGLNFRPGISGRKRVKAFFGESTVGSAGSINWVNDSSSGHIRHSEHGLKARLTGTIMTAEETSSAEVMPDKIEARYSLMIPR